jgi:hypothetical protein
LPARHAARVSRAIANVWPGQYADAQARQIDVLVSGDDSFTIGGPPFAIMRSANTHRINLKCVSRAAGFGSIARIE